MRILKYFVFFLLLVCVAASIFFGVAYLFPEKTTDTLLSLERQRSNLVRKEIILDDGDKYVFLEGGTGEALMLLHGFGANKDNFTRVARFLTPRYRVIIVDHVGFGESSHPKSADYSPTAQADRLRQLAKALGIGHLHLGGSSMGGHIALTWAAKYPTEILSLWLLSPGGVWSAPTAERQKIQQETGKNPLMASTADEFRALYGLVMNDPPYIPSPILNVFAKERIKNFTLEEKIFKQITADSVEERVKGLETPALIVWGERDRVLSKDSAGILHQLMPNSTVIIMPEIGHLPMVEAARRTARDYLQFRMDITL